MEENLQKELENFKKHGHELIDWIASYYENIQDFPVKAQVQPKEVFNTLDQKIPEESESLDTITADFKDKILPGMTHWQSPGFHAYFTANTSFPSLLAEMLTSAMGAQCMIWDTSPAAAELEELTMNWLRDILGLPQHLTGVIQDTASTATLCSLLTAREKLSKNRINEEGLYDNKKLRIYCSEEAHSSVEKAAKIAGIGKNNVVKIKVNEDLSMNVIALEKAIQHDFAQNYQPLAVVAALGTTGTLAVDSLDDIGELCDRHDIWFHVDAAYAGSALLLEEYRWMIKGIAYVDTFVYNPHKWLFTNFDCTAYFVKDKDALINTFSILPEYLKTNTRGQVNDYRDWGIQLGRRFRSLKLWFVMRSFGRKGLEETIRKHISLTKALAEEMQTTPGFEITSQTLNLICFRLKPSHGLDEEGLNQLNKNFNDALNQSGKVYLTHTRVHGKYILRMVIGQTYITSEDVQRSWQNIKNIARQFLE